tara:strand:- start:122 stop:487 length:366 start_codon:yes stop_codon:yes gene_type:complete
MNDTLQAELAEELTDAIGMDCLDCEPSEGFTPSPEDEANIAAMVANRDEPAFDPIEDHVMSEARQETVLVKTNGSITSPVDVTSVMWKGERLEVADQFCESGNGLAGLVELIKGMEAKQCS